MATVAHPLQRIKSRVALEERAWQLLATAAGVLVLAITGGIVYFIVREAWPALSHNGVGFLGDSSVPLQRQMDWSFNGAPAGRTYREMHAWPAIAATLLSTGGALLVSVPLSIGASILIAVLAPRPLRRVLATVVRLLVGVPSVVFGLVGLLVFAPLVERFLIDQQTVDAYSAVFTLQGTGLLTAVVVLTAMIAPLMIGILVDAFDNVPVSWREGSLALGVDEWRTMRRLSLHWIRPAIVGAAILGTGRAVGEAIALSMVAGSTPFIPNPLDGTTFFFEPISPLAALIIGNSDGIGVQPLRADLYAFGALLLLASITASVAGRIALLPGRSLRRGR